MTQLQSPWLEGAYGWDFGEGGWNSGMDQNLLKFSFMFDRNVDSVVGSLPAVVNGQAHYLTTDNRLYFAVGATYFSTPVPKWFEFKDRSTGNTYQFNGVSATVIDSPAQLDMRLDATELTISALGTAAFKDVGFFASRAELDVSEASSQSYTDTQVTNLQAKFAGSPLVAQLTPSLTDYSAEINAFAATLTGGQTGRILPGIYPCESALTFPKDAKLLADGVVLDFSAASTIGNFPNSRCVEFTGGSLTELASPSVAPVAGGYVLTFAALPAVSSDDVLVIWNDTPGSWNNFRPAYTAGEFVVVRNTTGTDVILNSPLIEGYTTSVRVFKMTTTTPKVVGLELRLPKTLTVSGLYTTFSRNAEFYRVKATNTGVAGITIDRSIGFTISNCETTSDRSVAVADNYGLSISNCQWGLVTGGRYESRRHAITLGGSTLTGSAPTRFIKVLGVHLSSWDIQCGDMHGNVEFSTFDNCSFMNGVAIGGNNNAVRNSNIYCPVNSVTADVAIAINELRGTSLTFENLKIVALGNPYTAGRGIIDCGGNSNAMTADTVRGGVMTFRNIDMSAALANNPIKITNRGSTAVGREVHIQMNCWDSPTTRLINGQVSVVSGDPFARVTYDIKFPNSGAPATTPLNATLISGMKEGGSVGIVSTATTFQDTPIVFKRAFPKAPSVRVQGNQSSSGANVMYAPISVTATGFTARVYTPSGSMTAGIAINLMWSAELDE